MLWNPADFLQVLPTCKSVTVPAQAESVGMPEVTVRATALGRGFEKSVLKANTRLLNVNLAVRRLPLLWVHRDVTIHRLCVT